MEDFGTSGATKAPLTRRLEVLSGPERRRRYSDEEKAALVAETFRPGVCTADLARRHGLHPQQLYTWRRQARRGELVLRDEDLPMFATLVAAAPAAAETAPQSGDDHLLVLEVGEVPADRPCCAAGARGRARGGAARGMILPGGPVRVYVATRPVDFRKGSTASRRWRRRSCGSIRSPGWCWCSARSVRTG